MTAMIEVPEPVAGRSSQLFSELPIAIAVHLLGVSVYLSSWRMMWLDEFFAWGVLTDPSLSHAKHAWLGGADSGAPYFILAHTLQTSILRITRPKA